jgi:hypothetical protein
MLEQNATAPGIWLNAIPHERLNMGLTVMKEPDTIATRLETLYGQCGLKKNTNPSPPIEYESFTPYSIYSWQIDREFDRFAMWQTITPNVLYDDGTIRILHPKLISEGTAMYHCFPQEKMHTVKSMGIVHHNHASLHARPDRIYAPAKIEFHRKRPATGSVFCIRVTPSVETLELRISVPAWFASEIFIATRTPCGSAPHT